MDEAIISYIQFFDMERDEKIVYVNYYGFRFALNP